MLCGCQASPGEQAVVRAHWSGLAAHDVVLPCFGVVVGLAKEPELLQAELDRRLGAPEQAASADGAIDLADEATTGGGASR